MEFPYQHNGFVLTRAARKKAGVPPPTPFLSRAPSTDHNNITIQQPSTKVLLQAANENTTSEEISANSLNFNKTQKQIVKELDVNASKESKGFSSEANRDGQRRSRSKRGVVEQRSCESSDSSDDEERVVWVECERGECGKWRRLPPDTVIDQSKEWYCTMHPDPHMSCDLPEETWEVSHKRAFTFSRLEPGALVWAKMTSYPQWPAVVSPDPWSEDMDHVIQEREGCIYHVEFLGRSRSHIWIQEEKIEPYRARSSSTHQSQRGRRRGKGKGRLSCSSMTARPRPPTLQHAISVADSLVKLCNQERLDQCVFKERTAIKTEPISQQRRENKIVKIERKDSQNENKIVRSEKTNVSVSSNGKSQSISDSTTQQSHSIRKKRGRPPSNTKPVNNAQTQLLRCLSINMEENVAQPLAMTTFLQSIQSQLSILLTSTPPNPLTSTGGVSTNIQSLNTSVASQQASIKGQTVTTINRPTTQEPGRTTNTSSTVPAKHLKPVKTRNNRTNNRQKTKQVSPTKLIQAGLGKSPNTNIVQVVPKAVPVRRVVKPVSKRGRAVCVKTVSPSIVDYFKKGGGGPVESSLSSLDTEMASAERELQEMQTLLSTFGPIEQEDITASSEKTDVCTSTVEQNSPKESDCGYLSAEFDSALSELYSIEALIQATSDQQVPSL